MCRAWTPEPVAERERTRNVASGAIYKELHMEITLHTIKVSELVENYCDNDEMGVTGYNGKLDIRPPYQREFCYKDNQQQAVMDTVIKGFPLNTMYWVERDDGRYEVLDGQQRTISICRYVSGVFSHNLRYFGNLQPDEKKQILDYELQVYFCKGTDSEKLDWFKTINIAGEKLTAQEIRNAVYAGSWTADAKKVFSKSNCAAYLLAKDYVNGNPIRQELLETAIGWYSGKEDSLICNYMAKHQNDVDATGLWGYFQNVITWVKTLFPKYRKEMKGVDWGMLYNIYHEGSYSASKLEEVVARLMADEDVTKKSGIYYYVFDGKESHLSVRDFDARDKRTVYEKQKGICPLCGKHFDIVQMQGDHILPWSKGGKTTLDNLQMLCIDCNLSKSSKSTASAKPLYPQNDAAGELQVAE